MSYEQHPTVGRTITVTAEDRKLAIGYYKRLITLRESEAFKNRNGVWTNSKLGGKNYIGHCMKMIDDCNPPQTAEGYGVWHRFYMANGGEKRLHDTALLYAEVAGLPYGAAYNEVLVHAVDETWEGHVREFMAKRTMENFICGSGLPYSVEAADRFLDETASIDVVVYDEHGNPILGLQVKPQKFFRSARVSTEQKKKMLRNQVRWQEQTGAAVAYASYEGDTERGKFTPYRMVADYNNTHDGVPTYKKIEINEVLNVPDILSPENR